MKLMIDTNIIIDVLTERESFFEESKSVLKLCEEKTILGFITASTVTDIFYLVRRHTHDVNAAYSCLGYLLNIVKILPVTNDNIVSAYLVKAKDFEDCLLAECAKSNGCGGIVTRNKKDFSEFGVQLFSPSEAVQLYSK